MLFFRAQSTKAYPPPPPSPLLIDLFLSIRVMKIRALWLESIARLFVCQEQGAKFSISRKVKYGNEKPKLSQNCVWKSSKKFSRGMTDQSHLLWWLTGSLVKCVWRQIKRKITPHAEPKALATSLEAISLGKKCFFNSFLSFQITKIGYVIHKTASRNFQVLAGSASFLFPSYCLGKFQQHIHNK